MRKQSDYFAIMESLTREVQWFLRLESIREWYAQTGYNDHFGLDLEPVSMAIRPSHIPEVEENLKGYTAELIRELEGYEMFELCQQVQDQINLFMAQISKIKDYNETRGTGLI